MQEGEGVGLAGDRLLHEVGAAVAGVSLDAQPGRARADVLDGGGELARVQRIFAGTNEIMKIIIAKQMGL